MTAPLEKEEPAAPAEVAEGEESPAAAQAQASSSQSAAAAAGAESASVLPGVHSQVSEAAPAKHIGQDATEAERTASPAAVAASPSAEPSSPTPPAGKLSAAFVCTSW